MRSKLETVIGTIVEQHLRGRTEDEIALACFVHPLFVRGVILGHEHSPSTQEIQLRYALAVEAHARRTAEYKAACRNGYVRAIAAIP